MMKKPFFTISILFLFLSLLTGCWDSLDLEQRTTVLSIGIDLTEDKKQYILTVQIPIPQEIMGGAGAEKGDEAIRVMSAVGKTLYETADDLQNRLNQELFYGHVRIIVFSEEAAKKGIKELIDPLRRSPQVRRLLWPLVVRGKASDLLRANPKLEQIPAVYLMDLLETGVERQQIPDISLGDLFNHLSTKTAQASMNYVSATDVEVKWAGIAVFRGDKMVGTLKDDEVWAYIQMRDEKLGGEIDVPCMTGKAGKKKTFVSFRPKTIKVKKTFSIRGEESFSANYHVRLEGDVIESQCDHDLTNNKDLHQLQDQLSKEAERRAKQTVAKLQKLHSDALKLGLLARSQSAGWWSDEKWDRVFPQGDIAVKYDVLIRRTGMELE